MFALVLSVLIAPLFSCAARWVPCYSDLRLRESSKLVRAAVRTWWGDASPAPVGEHLPSPRAVFDVDVGAYTANASSVSTVPAPRRTRSKWYAGPVSGRVSTAKWLTPYMLSATAHQFGELPPENYFFWAILRRITAMRAPPARAGPWYSGIAQIPWREKRESELVSDDISQRPNSPKPFAEEPFVSLFSRQLTRSRKPHGTRIFGGAA